MLDQSHFSRIRSYHSTLKAASAANKTFLSLKTRKRTSGCQNAVRLFIAGGWGRTGLCCEERVHYFSILGHWGLTTSHFLFCSSVMNLAYSRRSWMVTMIFQMSKRSRPMRMMANMIPRTMARMFTGVGQSTSSIFTVHARHIIHTIQCNTQQHGVCIHVHLFQMIRVVLRTVY